MLFYLVTSVLLLLFQTLIVLTTKINIFPELVYYPWIMSKGLHIYRDFTIQHGYFMQLLLIPFAIDKSLLMMKGFFVSIQILNLLLVLRILRKTTNKLGFILGGGLFVILNYYLVDSNLWDETILTSFYLLIYQLLLGKGRENTIKILVIGFLVGAVSFMKPSFGIMIIPVIIFTRSFISIIPIAAIWIVSSLYFLLNNSFNVFINNYIFFNTFYASTPRTWSIDSVFIMRTLVFLITSIVLYFIYRKKFIHNPIFLFTILSIALFFPSYNKINLVPFGAFFSLLVGQLFSRAKKISLYIFIVIFLSYGIFLGRQAKHLYMYFKTYRLPYMENKQTIRIVNKMSEINEKNERVYVLGNNVEIYYFLDMIAPVWYPIIWPIDLRYDPTIEKKVIDGIRKNKVTLIIMPKPLSEHFRKLTLLMGFIKKSYIPSYEDGEMLIFKKR